MPTQGWSSIIDQALFQIASRVKAKLSVCGSDCSRCISGLGIASRATNAAENAAAATFQERIASSSSSPAAKASAPPREPVVNKAARSNAPSAAASAVRSGRRPEPGGGKIWPPTTSRSAAARKPARKFGLKNVPAGRSRPKPIASPRTRSDWKPACALTAPSARESPAKLGLNDRYAYSAT